MEGLARWVGRLGRSWLSVVTFMLALPMAVPLYWMVSSSIKSEGEIFSQPPTWIPGELRLSVFEMVFEMQPFAVQYFNSMYIAALNVVGTLVIAAFTGYALAQIRFRGASVLLVVLLSGLLMPGEVLIIPLYIMARELGWLGTHLPLIVEPVLGASAVVGTFLMRQHFLSFPRDLADAGRLDGLGHFGIFRMLAMPLAKPALASVAILAFLTSWNAYLEPLIFVGGNVDLATLPVGLTLFTTSQGRPVWNVQMAAATLSVIPIIIVFLAGQKQFMESVATTGLKG